ncbi:MAG: hypothetical protein ACAH59_10875 [Pseudobdellovibrionaceae bacterium]
MKILRQILIIFFLGLIPALSEAAIAFRNKTFTVKTSPSTSTTLTEPTSAAQNDIIFVWAVLGYQTVTASTPTGWTLLYTIQTNQTKTYLYWIRRGASAPTYTFTYSSVDYAEFSVTAWSGVITSGSPIDVSASNASVQKAPAHPDCPSVTTTVANTVVIAFGMGWSGWSTIAGTPSGYTAREVGVNGNNNDLAVFSKAVAVAGAENPAAITGALNPGVSNDVAEVTVALKPDGASSAAPIRHRVIQN